MELATVCIVQKVNINLVLVKTPALRVLLVNMQKELVILNVLPVHMVLIPHHPVREGVVHAPLVNMQ